MNINSVFSAGKAPETPGQVQELLKNIIITTNYLPGVRSGLGWRGIFRIPGEYECWTFRISGYDGVFGLGYSCSGENNDNIYSEFSIYYFPSPDEDMVDSFAINGAVYVYTADYRELIRRFPEHPEFSEYFITGKLIITCNTVNPGIIIGIESMSESVVISENGIKSGGKTGEFIVHPGDAEQNIPEYDLCSAVFEIIVSSMAHLAGDSPSAVKLIFYPGQKAYFRDGILRYEQCDDITSNSLAALYTGSRVLTDLFSEDTGAIGKAGSVLWMNGMPEIPQEFAGFRFLNGGGTFSTALNRSLLGIEIKPTLYVISGFLGSGKTTFIRNFLEFQAQKYLFGAVIQNELGETGIDGKLISGECRVVEVDEGCVCCSLSGNLRRGINSIISEFVPDFIILETTGAANPVNLISEICDLSDIIRFDSVTTIVDSASIIETINDYDIAADQLKAADVIILNKTDLLKPHQIESVKRTAASLNKRALIVQSVFARVNPSLIYDLDTVFHDIKQNIQTTVHKHTNHSDDGLSTQIIQLPEQVDRIKFLEKIKTIPFDIFRIKGFIKIDDEEEYSLFQYVAGRYDISKYGRSSIPPFIVLIGRDVKNPEVTEYFTF